LRSLLKSLPFVDRFRARWVAPAASAGIALLALAGGFSTTRIFYLRDLAFLFWPLHVWLRETLLAGASPFWDPSVAFGQPAIADPVRQILFPPTLLARILLPTVLGFNATVALAFPTAAAGMCLFLRRRVSTTAAVLGACVFALSGPVLSTGNMLNLSWSVAMIPWMLWAVDGALGRAPARRIVALAFATALQILAGEPVTLAATGALVSSYAVVASEGGPGDRLRAFARALGGIVLGALLSGIQLLPLVDATARSARSGGFGSHVTRVWQLHPLRLPEALVPGLFGDPWSWNVDWHLWVNALNDGREPFLYSIYFGVGAVALALCGAFASPVRGIARFWCVVAVAALLCAVGDFTPAYPALQSVVPPVRSFRIPSKYFVFVAVALAPLAALGWEALASSRAAPTRMPRSVVAAAVTVAALAATACGLVAWSALAPDSAASAATALARALGVARAEDAGRFLTSSSLAGGLRLTVLASSVAGALWLSATGRREARIAAVALFVAAVLDPLVVNSTVNPTTEVGRLGRPEWLALVPPGSDGRTYIGGRLAYVTHGEPNDIDNPPVETDLEARPYSFQEHLAIGAVRLATFPSPWSIRDSVSIDNNAIWPREYTHALKALKRVDRAARTRFLTGATVRYFLVPEPPSPSARPLGPAPGIFRMAVYEEPSASPRAAVVSRAELEPAADRAVDRLLASEYDPNELVLVDSDVAPAGVQGSPRASAAAVVEDLPTFVTIRADVPADGGYLVLRDSYSPFWRAEVDGSEAPLLRADGLFRAVRLAQGTHTVRLVFVPTPVYSGAAVSALTLLLLTWLALRRGSP
jgi:hypothetical protein